MTPGIGKSRTPKAIRIDEKAIAPLGPDQGIARLLFSKAVATAAFALIALLGVSDMLAGNTSFAATAIVVIAALGAVGFGFAAWADK